MPKRIYVGAHDAVELVVADQVASVARGGEVEVDDETAAEMDQSAAWSETKLPVEAEEPTKPAASGKE